MKNTGTNKRSAPAQEAFVRILRVRELLYAGLARLLKPFGLTEPQYNVLRIIRGAGPDGLPCLEIGRRMITRVPDVTRLLERLEAMQLVARERSNEDRRVVMAHLTDKGHRLLRQLDEPVAAEHESQLAALSKSEQAEVIRLMDKILAG